jgi:hypothetical protein
MVAVTVRYNIYGALTFVAFVKEEGFKAFWKLIDKVPDWSVSTWIAIGFALLFILAIEGSLELTVKNKTAQAETLGEVRREGETKIATAQVEISALRDELRELRKIAGLPDNPREDPKA